MLSEREQKILEYIETKMELDGSPPTIREICSDLQIKSTSTAHKEVNRLIEEGYLVKRRNKNRSLRSPRREERSREPGKEIPILGTVAAGTPITAVENIIGYIHYEPEKQHDNPLFALKVRGESMINAGICDGDLIIVEQTAYAENGDIVVALLDQEEATVKRFYKENGHFRLQPENDAMDPIYTEDLDLVGVVVALLRIYS